MRSFRSKSLVLRGRKSESTLDPLPDLKSLIPADIRQAKQKLESNGNSQSIPFHPSNIAPPSDPDRPVTAGGLHKSSLNRDSFSRPRTATSNNRRNLLVNSLRNHNIDPYESCLVDNENIGLALGSPTQTTFHSAAASPVVPTVRSSDVESGDNASTLKEKPATRSRQRSNTWKAMGSLFSRKRQIVDEPLPPPVPAILSDSLPAERMPVNMTPPATNVTPPDESYSPRFSSHFTRRRKSEAEVRPRRSLTLRRKQKHDREDEIPALPTEQFPSFEPPSLGEVDIPTSTMDRFSIMFGSVLQDQSQLSTSQRYSKGRMSLLPRQNSNDASQLAVLESSPRPDPPPAYTSSTGQDFLFPHVRRRSATSPNLAPPGQPEQRPDNTPPPPPISPLLDSSLMFGQRQRSSVSSSMSTSTISSAQSRASLLSTELEHYYLPTRALPSSDTAPSSSRSSQTFPTLLQDKPDEPVSLSRTSSPAPSTVEDNGDDGSSLLNSQLTLTSVPSSSYVSARAFPSPSSSVHHLHTQISPRASLYMHQHQQQHGDGVNPYSPSTAYGYSDPHSPLLEMARSAPTAVRAGSTVQGRARIISRDVQAGVASNPNDASSHLVQGPRMPLGESRCSTPRVVCVDQAQRRVSQWGLLEC